MRWLRGRLRLCSYLLCLFPFALVCLLFFFRQPSLILSFDFFANTGSHIVMHLLLPYLREFVEHLLRK